MDIFEFFGIIVLLYIFQLKHLYADYFLQFPYMYLNKGKPGITNWVRPLFDHSFVHAVFTYAIIYAYMLTFDAPADMILYVASSAALFDLVTHFVTDRWKATRGVNYYTEDFWYNLGFDQFVHHVVGITIIAFVAIEVHFA